MHFDFESVRVCYFDIDLGMSSLSNKWEPFFGERAKRARHSQVCSIENRGYIYNIYIY